MFRYSTTLKLRDTDAAGVAFFAAYFAIAHDAYESFLVSCGAHLRDWLGEVHLPIVHSHADYTAPLRLSDAFEVELTCPRVGEHSFTLHYHFVDHVHERTLARLETVHVAVKFDDRKHESVPLPEQVRSVLSGIKVGSDQARDAQRET